MSDDSWKQVVVEADPAAMKPVDIAHLGPPPRDVTPVLAAYIKKAKPSFAGLWLAVAVISTVSYGGFIAAEGFQSAILVAAWWPIVSIALALWTGRGAKRRRAALRATLRDGQLRFARLVENLQTPVGQGMGKRFRYTAYFDVDGRRVPLVTMNDAMSMLNRGQLVEVVYNPAVPDEIVPAFLLV